MRTIAATKIMSNTTWAITIVCSPSVNRNRLKNDSSPIASTMSGITAGRNSTLSSTRLRTVRCSPIASNVPSTVEIAVTNPATINEFSIAASSSSLPTSSRYHRVEKPPQTVASSESLNDSTTSTAIGRYRKAKSNPMCTRR